jgi:predicted phage terminase large subunit-like protein
MKLLPQPKQEKFLRSSADIAIFGGAAFSGKTFALLMECARYSNYGNFGAVIFRREAKQVDNEGGLRDTALQLYAGKADYRSQPTKQFIFPSDYKVSLCHLNQESDVISWHGSQIGLLCFDELTTFTSYQFWYMLSRNRSTVGIKPRCIATCNPDPDSWVADFIEWWIDQDTGYPIKERSGVVRYLLRRQNRDGIFGLNWGSTREDLLESLGYGKPSQTAIESAKQRIQKSIENGLSPVDDSEEVSYLMERQAIKSVTFVPGNIYDNPIGMVADPSYIANLKAQDPVNRARLLDGNWKVRRTAGAYFPDSKVQYIDSIPPNVDCWLRAWDLAATETTEVDEDPDYTVGILMGRLPNDWVVIADVKRFRKNASFVREMIKATAIADGKETMIYIPQDPGQAGKYQIASFRELLVEYAVVTRTVTNNKVAMAEPVAAMWQTGTILVLRAPWNDSFIRELDLFDSGRYDDQVDALTGGLSVLPHSAPDYSTGGIRRNK